ncbi:hypothetical protein FZEAL_507 [Fusarium zealandicum]|uniref:RNAse P Rpr2/Rpp21 subunit domain-containing protein n=1 Tax=Fusarium zealandicum TaxID=1053134 RepID=A0A8H4UUP0_9HYPO|nr:hypothetical protein FZEAL_507 [Fusarium zealandicum]
MHVTQGRHPMTVSILLYWHGQETSCQERYSQPNFNNIFFYEERPSMAKAKEPKGVQNRHIYSRASYLYQAATYLANQHGRHGQAALSKSSTQDNEHNTSTPTADEKKATQNMSRQMISSLRAVALKSQIRQSPSMKQTICKSCDTFLVEGETCTSTVENASKGGRKPWADVLTIRCKTCGKVKRYPVSAPRQKRKTLRKPEREEPMEDIPTETRSLEPTPGIASESTPDC